MPSSSTIPQKSALDRNVCLPIGVILQRDKAGHHAIFSEKTTLDYIEISSHDVADWKAHGKGRKNYIQFHC